MCPVKALSPSGELGPKGYEVVKVDEERVREVNLRLSNVYGDSTVGINNPPTPHSSLLTPHSSPIYNLSGMKMDSLTRGINIVRNEDGTITKRLIIEN